MVFSGFHAIVGNLVRPRVSMGKNFDSTRFHQADNDFTRFDGRELSLHALLRKRNKFRSAWIVPVYQYHCLDTLR